MKLLEVNNHVLGENSPNLVTLLATHQRMNDHDFCSVDFFGGRKLILAEDLFKQSPLCRNGTTVARKVCPGKVVDWIVPLILPSHQGLML
jgi:hypothetical protein